MSQTKKRIPRAQREQEMLDAAIDVFARNGYHAAGVEEVAEKSGVSKPMVYLYFGSKELLFIACIRRECGRLMDLLGGSITAQAGPQEQLRAGLAAFLTFVHRHRQAWSVLYRQARSQGDPVSSDVANLRANMVRLIKQLLEESAHAAGHKPNSHKVGLAAHALVGSCESLADWMLDHPESNPKEVTEELMRFAGPGMADILSSN